MTIFKTILPVLLVLFISCVAKTDISKSGKDSEVALTGKLKEIALNGLYAGLEEICWTDSTGKKECYGDPANPKWKWYHLGYLKIRDDSVFLDQDPISVYKSDTSYSSSDGAFYYYSGTLQRNDTTVVFNLKELFCDYCGVPVKVNADGTREVVKRTKRLEGRLTGKGIEINGYLYARTTKKESLVSEHPGLFLKSQ